MEQEGICSREELISGLMMMATEDPPFSEYVTKLIDEVQNQSKQNTILDDIKKYRVR